MSKNIIIVLLVVLCSILGVSLYYETQLSRQCREDLRQAGLQRKPDRQIIDKEPYIKKEVHRTIISYFSALQNCYQQFVKTGPEVKTGKLLFRWIATGQGQVRSLEMIRSPFNAPSFEQCVRQVVFSMTFPKPPFGKETPVEHTFNFADSE